MRGGILLFFVCMCGCAVQSRTSDRSMDVLKLDFTDCSDSIMFSQIEVLPLSGYRLKKVQDHQFCEYLLEYKDGSVLYLSTNIYDGSRLNVKNRYEKNINTYSLNRSMYDTIRNSGVQSDKKHWLEWINGSYVIGYVNAMDSTKFDEALESIRLIEDHQ